MIRTHVTNSAQSPGSPARAVEARLRCGVFVEAVGFEPTERHNRSQVFKTCAINRTRPHLRRAIVGSRLAGRVRGRYTRRCSRATAVRGHQEASPSQVYGAGLLIPLGCKPLARSNRAASARR